MLIAANLAGMGSAQGGITGLALLRGVGAIADSRWPPCRFARGQRSGRGHRRDLQISATHVDHAEGCAVVRHQRSSLGLGGSGDVSPLGM